MHPRELVRGQKVAYFKSHRGFHDNTTYPATVVDKNLHKRGKVRVRIAYTSEGHDFISSVDAENLFPWEGKNERTG